jgi:hypothetical protein
VLRTGNAHGRQDAAGDEIAELRPSAAWSPIRPGRYERIADSGSSSWPCDVSRFPEVGELQPLYVKRSNQYEVSCQSHWYRRYPVINVVSKQLLPVFDKPMVYYPLSTLMFAGIREILIITTPQDVPLFQRLLGDGSELGMHFSYAGQAAPRGIADAFIVGREFIGSDPVALILGDNIFYGHGLREKLVRSASRKTGATVFGYVVNTPEHYGVVELDHEGRALSMRRSPSSPNRMWLLPVFTSTITPLFTLQLVSSHRIVVRLKLQT